MRITLSATLFVLSILLFASCKQKNGYKITGKLDGIQGKGYAILQDYITYKEDTADFIDGQFEFSGTLSTPKLCRIYFIGSDDSLAEQLKSDLLYLENEEITCSGSYDKMMFYFGNTDTSLQRMKVEGGHINKIYNLYLSDTRSIVNKAAQLSRKLEYPEVPAEKMSEKEYLKALDMQVEMQELLNKRDSVKDVYIQKYADTQLAYDFVFASMAMDHHFEDWIDEGCAHGNEYPEYMGLPDTAKTRDWIRLLKQQNKFTAHQIDTLKTLANKCEKLTPGAPFIDGIITNENGDSLTLGSVLGKDQYTVIDCWASWCHPCRASLPHLKQLYEKYQPKGLQIIGLSLDGQMMKKQWLNAVEKEELKWPQFLTDFESDIMKSYKVQAIPNILIIGPDKKIIKTGVRGFDLDIILKNIYGY